MVMPIIIILCSTLLASYCVKATKWLLFSIYWDGQTQTHEPRDRPCSGGRDAVPNVTWLVPVLIAWNVLQVHNVYFTATA